MSRLYPTQRYYLMFAPISRRNFLKGSLLAAAGSALAIEAATFTTGKANEMTAIQTPLTGISKHDVKVATHAGRTRIVIDGKPVPQIAYLGPVPFDGKHQTTSLLETVDAGVRIVLVDGGGHWTAPGKYDFSDYLRKLDTVAKLAPDMWLVLRIGLNAPDWWRHANPDECIRHADSQGPEANASMGSDKWIADSSDYLKAAVLAAETSPIGSRILGYSLMCAHGGEWVYPGAGGGRLGDYSPAALRYYRNWLRRKYGNEPWIDAAQIPTPQERGRSLPAMLRDPKLDQRVIDFDQAFSDMGLDNILAMTGLIKQLTASRRLTGVFYGYLLWQTGLVNSVATNGHLALRRLLDSPDIDFVTSFPSYDVREHGSAAPILLPVESIQAAGKLLFNECDNRTHLTKCESTADRFYRVRNNRDPLNGPPLEQGTFNLLPLELPQFSVDILRREFAHHLIRGSAWWWFDMAGGWYSGKEINGEFRKQMEIAKATLDWDMSSVSQVAGIVSGQSPAYHSMMRMFDVDPQPSLVELQADLSTREMYKAGAPIDWLMMDDLNRPAMEQYRALYLHNPTFLTDVQRKALDKLKCDGRVMIFIGYPGLVADGKLDDQAASRAAGMKLKLVHTRAAARFVPQDYDLPCLQDATAQLAIGGGVVLSPRLIVDDPQAQTIANWPDGAPAAAMRKHDGWTSYYFPVPPNNAQLFRAIFRNAGCHIYTSPICHDVLFANKSLLALHTNHYFQPVTLPRPARVTDLFTGSVVVEEGTQLPTGRPWHWTGGTNLYHVEY